MGIYATRFYFKAALPQISAIKTKFKEITGLDLDYSPAIELNELATDAEDFLYYFSKSIEGGKHLKYTYAWFSCEGFANVYLDDYMRPAEQSFYLECGIKIENMYFFHALSKTMLELGGNIFSYTFIHSDFEPSFASSGFGSGISACVAAFFAASMYFGVSRAISFTSSVTSANVVSSFGLTSPSRTY